MKAWIIYVLQSIALLTMPLGSASEAWAQSAQGRDLAAFEFSTNAAAGQDFTVRYPGRHAATTREPAAIVPPAPPRPVANGTSTRHPPAAELVDTIHAGLFQHLFLSGVADLVRGDPADAADIFDVTAHIADDLPQMQYLLALARVLSDFDHRDRMLAPIQRIVAEDPDQPLYAILEVLADRRSSVLGRDGALYLTRDGARRLSTAASKLATRQDAYNGKYFAMLVEALAGTGDTALPQRFDGFARMLGQGRTIMLPNVATPQALGRLLVLAIPGEQLARYETRFLTGATDGREAAMPATDQRRAEATNNRAVATR